MMAPRTTRRVAALSLTFVWALVSAGLGWATWSAIRLEKIEAGDQLERAHQRAKQLALAWLDAIVDSTLGRERTRPYEHFRGYYTPAEARYVRDDSAVREPIVVPSPLRARSGPDWLLLHFQVSETQGWSSPQVERSAENAPPAGAIPATMRAREATAANWLAALRERYNPFSLQQVLQAAQTADLERRQSFTPSSRDEAGRHAGSLSKSVEPEMIELPASGAEFARRGQRMLRMERESFPVDRCEPETVAMDNLEAGGEWSPGERQRTECVQVTATPMMPVWLDLTTDGPPQLALVRSATVETSRYCTLQGVLIDWPKLREVLETEVHYLFPTARIVPVRTDEMRQLTSGSSASLTTFDLVQSIPARLDVRTSPGAAAPRLSTAFTLGLVVAWLTTVIALAAISYGTMKYLGIAERRMHFVAAVTHELRTPLTSFQLYSDLLAEVPPNDSTRRTQYLETLRTEANRLARLVENVLAYSRIGDSTPKLKWQPATPAALLESVRQSVADACKASGKELVVEDHCPPMLTLETDCEFVLQILTNLIENACKYGTQPDDRRIWVSATPGTAGSVIFEVDDAGMGVSARDRRAIFEPFRRGASAQTTRAGGLGLGLSLSRYWANCLRGNLVLKRSPRNGAHFTCFELMLPATRLEQ